MSEKIRNIGIMAHIDAGKTTVSERILYYTGRTHKISEVHDGDATMDFMEQERERGITISSAVTQFEWKEHSVFLIDTPGHVDFTVEVERSLRVLDGAVALFDAVSGVEPQSETVWFQADKYHVPRIAFVNKMDRPGADMDACIEQMRSILKANPVAVQIPVFEDHRFVGIVDIISMKAYRFDENSLGSSIIETPIPDADGDHAAVARLHLIEQLADIDNDIAALYLDGKEPDENLIRKVLRYGTIHRLCVPVLCGSGLRNKGIQPLLDAVVDYLPAPDELPGLVTYDKNAELIEIARKKDETFCALIFKVQHLDGKKLLFLRIYSGMLREGDAIFNSTLNESFKIKHIYRLFANRIQRIDCAVAGEIVALPKARQSTTGDTLCNANFPIVLERIDANAPVISIAVEAESVKERQKLIDAVSEILEEDPTLRFEENNDTGELILRGMGELHLDIVCGRLRRDYNLEIRQGDPDVVEKETLCQSASAVGTFHRETENEEIFGEVEISVSPLPRGSGCHTALSLHNDHPFVKDDIAKAAVEGARDAFSYGPGGLEMADAELHITRIACDNKYLSAAATRAASAVAVKKACAEAKSVTLQPIMQVDISTSEEHLGDIISDLSLRNGVIENIENLPLRSVVHALVPLRSMFGYSRALRSITHGRGAFCMIFHKFDTL